MSAQVLNFPDPGAGTQPRSGEEQAPGQLYVQVTRKEIIRGDKSKGVLPGRVISEHANPVAVDWLSMSQTHHDCSFPAFHDGRVMCLDSDGRVDWVVDRMASVEGSYDTKIRIRSDGKTVRFEGNPSRFGRRDNVFGFDWSDAVGRTNAILGAHGLPPFSPGMPHRFADSGWVWSGARASRIDVVVNHAAFSQRDAVAVLQQLSGHHLGRQKHRLFPDGTTLEIGGAGSRYVYHKIYLKHPELVAHTRRKSGQHVAQDVLDFCSSYGIMREELTFKSRFLTQNGLAFLGVINQSRLNDIFFRRSVFRRFDQVMYDDLSGMPDALRGTYEKWRRGESLDLKQATFYRRRKALLAYGVDIAVPSNVSVLPLRVRTVDVAAMVAPDWYRRKYG